MQQDVSPYLVEQTKLLADYLKHISTLSTGSIVLLTIFLEKLSQRPRLKTLMVLALCGFTLSLIASVVAFTGVIFAIPSATGRISREGTRVVWVVGVFGTWIGFLVGIISLTLFAVANLFKQQSVTQDSTPHH